MKIILINHIFTNFEKGRLKLKKLLMYQPETISEVSDQLENNNNNKCIVLGYDKIPEEKETEYEFEEEEENDNLDIINKKNKEKLKKEKINDYKTKIKNKIDEINQNSENYQNIENANNLENFGTILNISPFSKYKNNNNYFK